MDTLRLLDERFTFTQQRPLLQRQFIEEARKCGPWLSEPELEAWHRVRLLVPFYRLARDGREIARAHRRGEDAYHLAHWQPTARADLADARADGRLYDPASEPFIARRRLKRPLGERSYESSVYLYSRHQPTALPFLRQVRPRLKLKRTNGDREGRVDADRPSTVIFRERADGLRAAAIAATLLEPAYYSRIYHRLRLAGEENFDAYDRWRQTRPLLRPLRVLGVDAAWIKNSAESLHRDAHRIDPLGDWAEVIAAGEPEKWNSLSGEARAALEPPRERRAAASLLRRSSSRAPRAPASAAAASDSRTVR